MEGNPDRLQEALSDRYRVDGVLGRGGFATVYRVWNRRLGRAEALKVLGRGLEEDADFASRFMQEVRLVASLDHPSIVSVHEFGEAGGTYWYSMRLVVGRTLRQELDAAGTLDEREAARLAIPLLEALEYSHGRGIVHRDIKPENVILDEARRPHLMDFGVAKSTDSSVKTRTGLFLGTPAYVAPEQARGKPLDGRADVYALGITLYKAVSGSYPFEADDPLQAVVLRLTQPPRPLAEARPGIHPVFAAIVMRALEREPSRRWESARAMRDALDDFVHGRLADTASTRALGLVEVKGDEGPESGPGRAEESAGVTRPSPVRGTEKPAGGSSAAPARRGTPLSVRAALVAAGLGVLVLGGLGLVALFRKGPEPEPQGPFVAPPPTALPLSPPIPTPSPAPAVEPTPPVLRVVRPTSAPTPAPASPPASAAAPAGRPVTMPARREKDPPFSGPAPEGCSGLEVSVLFTVDESGAVVQPKALSTDLPAACVRHVLEALPRWTWDPARDAAGRPVPRAVPVLVPIP